MVKYWVIGGQYADTNFQNLAQGAKEMQIGPFTSYEEAHKQWAAKAWSTVDDCTSCFRIVKRDEEDFALGTD